MLYFSLAAAINLTLGVLGQEVVTSIRGRLADRKFRKRVSAALVLDGIDIPISPQVIERLLSSSAFVTLLHSNGGAASVALEEDPELQALLGDLAPLNEPEIEVLGRSIARAVSIAAAAESPPILQLIAAQL